MHNAATIVVLPGLDGTGLLLTEFADALGRDRRVDVISYPSQEPLSYDALIGYVKQRLPSEHYILVGESFSGPIALRIASEAPSLLKGVVLGASFARLDLPCKQGLARLAKWIPATAIPFVAFNTLLMNGRGTAEQRRLMKQVLQEVSPAVLSRRAQDALQVDLGAAGIRIPQPLLYLRASADRLIPASAADFFSSIADDITIKDIPAPHFLFQAQPDLCAHAIVEFEAFLTRVEAGSGT